MLIFAIAKSRFDRMEVCKIRFYKFVLMEE